MRLVEYGDKRDDDFGDDCCDAAERGGVYVRLPLPCIDFFICLTAEDRSIAIRCMYM
jgi:hypothetical protein